MREKIKCPIESNGICKSLITRDMEPRDSKKALTILKEAFPHVYEREKEFWKELITLNPTIVLEMNDDIVGVSSMRKPQFIKNRNTSWIDLITVDSSYRRLGLGSVLLEQSLDLMKEMGAKRGKLFTEVKNTGAVSFYSKKGWEVTDYTQWGYKHAHRITMEYHL